MSNVFSLLKRATSTTTFDNKNICLINAQSVRISKINGLVCIEGNIGTGKSTFLTTFKKSEVVFCPGTC